MENGGTLDKYTTNLQDTQLAARASPKGEVDAAEQASRSGRERKFELTSACREFLSSVTNSISQLALPIGSILPVNRLSLLNRTVRLAHSTYQKPQSLSLSIYPLNYPYLIPCSLETPCTKP